MRFRTAHLSLGVALATICLGACSDSTSTSNDATSGGNAYVRVIDALFQGDTTSAVGVPIDYLIDSSSAAPGVLNLAPGAMTVGDSGNGYSETSAGVHSFVARVAGNTAPNSSVYTTTTNLPYLPKQALTPHTFYTIVVAGVIPDTGLIPNAAVNFLALVDDPFPGPTINDTVQARFRVINAAPFTTTSGQGTYLRGYLTPGSTPPANLIATYAPFGIYMAYGCSFGCDQYNAAPGSYTLTLADQSSNTIYGQTQVTFAPGDVFTFVLLSTGESATPGTGNHVIKVIHDHPAQ
jgi:hypothetical protein